MTAPPNGFAQKALIVLLGVISTALMAFFVWLATAVIEIRERVVRVETTMQSLVETRATQARTTGERNAARIDQLERNEQ